ncbi:MAG TPA: hypothetical protein VER96_19755 [Polyangiaceae bacterium]|nr:hypothetical protein [Polyangiaceae bacterium]
MAETNDVDPLARIAELSRRAVARAPSASDEALSLQLFLARVDAELASPLRKWGHFRWLLAVPAVVSVAASLLLFWRRPLLTFNVEGGERSGRYMRATDQASAVLRFSDASSLVASAGSRLRIEDATSHSARVLLERGQVSAELMHSSNADWTFAAGPYEMHTTESRFEWSWVPELDKFEVVLLEGSLELSGPGGSSRIELHSGQLLRGDAKQHLMQVGELEETAIVHEQGAH